jgi:hypothetical protein
LIQKSHEVGKKVKELLEEEKQKVDEIIIEKINFKILTKLTKS